MLSGVYSGDTNSCWIVWVELGVWTDAYGSRWNIWDEVGARVGACGAIHFSFACVRILCIFNLVRDWANALLITRTSFGACQPYSSNASSSFWCDFSLEYPWLYPPRLHLHLKRPQTFFYLEKVFWGSVVDIDDEAHDLLSLFDTFLKLSTSAKE